MTAPVRRRDAFVAAPVFSYCRANGSMPSTWSRTSSGWLFLDKNNLCR
ncbi:hypothetical protein [Myxococcus sp. RHSTA-1-4]|nr:hypothetical protein [Myxococcus sp. RHSTA-1-4]MBZ4419710.1 hypothetical protein [Myxococcus sp. RHSTA-1-4]